MATKNEILGIKFDELPNEVVMEVLARLPAKFIMPLKLVSKKWFHLITSNLCFRELYKARAGVREGGVTHVILPKGNYQAKSWDRRFFVINTKKPPKTRVSIYEPPLTYDVNAVTNMVDGLVCVYDQCEESKWPKSIYVHNICTGEILRLPPKEKKYCYRACFVGFDPTNMEYKVVRIYRERYQHVANCEVFTLDTNNNETMHEYRSGWRSIDISHIRSGYFYQERTWKWLEGTCFCVCSFVGYYWNNQQNMYDRNVYIILFDVEKEKFEIIKVPMEINGTVALIQGHLSLVETIKGSYDECNGCSMKIIWWKIFDLKNKEKLLFTRTPIRCPFPQFYHTHHGIRFNHLGHVFNERCIFEDTNRGVIDCYDLNTKKYKELEVNNIQRFLNTHTFDPFLVVENIIPLKAMRIKH